MRAAIVTAFGDASGIQLVDRQIPDPGKGQVVIRTEAIGVSGLDVLVRRGLLRGPHLVEGTILGSEVAGVVHEVGEDVDPAWVGRRVWAFTGESGGYAEYVRARATDVAPLPDGLTPVQAVTLGTAGPVAHFALDRARFRAAESVLVRGAAGSIGIAAVELAAQGGASSITVTTSSPVRGDRLRAHGATHVVDRTGAGQAPARVDVILDVVGGDDLPRFIDRLAPNGRLVTVGVIGGLPPADFGVPLLAGFRRSLTFGTSSLDTVAPMELDRVRGAQFAAAAHGRLSSVVDDVLPLEEVRAAHGRMDRGAVFGRIVLVP